MIQLQLQPYVGWSRAVVDESESRTSTVRKWISLQGRGLVFTITAGARANIGWISY